ncbi:MAG: excisionase family DNA-binding protein [Myxococcota bacterium]
MLLTAQEAAALLLTTEREVYRWVDEGAIPFRRVRDQVRFNRTDLIEWATTKGMPVSPEALGPTDETGARPPGLAAAPSAARTSPSVGATLPSTSGNRPFSAFSTTATSATRRRTHRTAPCTSMSGRSCTATASMLPARFSTASATRSTSPSVDDSLDARQSGNRLKVTCALGQYHLAMRIPGGSTRAYGV